MNILNSMIFSVPLLTADSLEDNITGQVFEALRQYIITGELQPNQRLVEADIAKKLGVSRTPVREALKRLEFTGYVCTSTSKGLVVTPEYSASQIRSLYEIREVLEVGAIKLACERATEEQINKAEGYYIKGAEAFCNGDDIDRCIELYCCFHEELYSACGNEQLVSLVRAFRYRYIDRRLARVYTRKDWRTQITHHSQILNAVRKRNVRLAEKALQKHLRASLEVALKRL